MSFLEKLFGDPNEKELRKARPFVDRINALEKRYEIMSEDELRAQTALFKDELLEGDALEDLLPGAFACVREASKRALGMRHFDVQLLGGVFLHKGTIVEMKTGEGKTLVATLPLFLNALTNQPAHLITVNDYLARRDAEWMGKIYDFLGMSVSVIQNQGVSYRYDKTHQQEISVSEQEVKERGLKQKPVGEKEVEAGDEDEVFDADKAHVDVEMRNLRPITRKEAYSCDIVYGTNNEFGFDYLRDNMAQDFSQKVQRGLAYGIVDEVDSILIDEARTPLIISAPAEESTNQYYHFAELVKRLKENEDYNIDEKMRAATLTEAGVQKMEEWLGMENIYVEAGMSAVHHIEQALRAHTLFKRDKDYVVKDGEILIVDEFTGRLMYGRRYSEGLHQAIEAQEGVEIKRESRTMATVTFQNYFRMYKTLAGMTGTAMTEAEEFNKIYHLEVVSIPTNKQVIRKDLDDRIYRTEAGKFQAVVADIKERYKHGQPVLVGTISIEKNEGLSELLTMEGIQHQVLNAKHHEKEAHIIAQAGKIAAVTVATNMAGRGVDIILGGNPPDQEEAEQIRELGGLHVIGTERHEARRIDNQLRGRSGRQGDPGSSRFYVSTEDDLMRIFGSDRIKKLMQTFKIPEDMPIENKLISRSIESAQRRVEGYHFDVRKHLVDYDNIMNKHREVIYKKRDELLLAWEQEKKYVSASNTDDEEKGREQEGEGREKQLETYYQREENENKSGKQSKKLHYIMMEVIEEEIQRVTSFHTASEDIKEWNLKEILETVRTIFPLTAEQEERIVTFRSLLSKNIDLKTAREGMSRFIFQLAWEEYAKLEKQVFEVSSGNHLAMRSIEKDMLLRAIDTLWVEHLEAMQHLRTGIGLRGYGQHDPLVEYKRESHHMFLELLDMIQKQVVYGIYKVGAVTQIAPSIIDIEKARLILRAPAKVLSEGAGQFHDVEETGEKQAGTGEPSLDVQEKWRTPDGAKIGRNAPCPCGSGKKYKKCHGN